MKKAIDIVLLPPEEIMDLAIGLNKPWVKGIDDEIALDKKTCLPHITLAMGLIEPDQIATVEKAMRGIAQQFSPLSLKIIAANTLNLEKIRSISELVIERSAELQRFHEAVMDQLAPRFTYDDVRKEMFYSPPVLPKVPGWWLNGSVKILVREKYPPHITLGLGKVKPLAQPIHFVASRLVLCQLGIHCTCRKILAEVNLGQNYE